MISNPISIDELKKFLIFLNFEQYNSELKDEAYKDEYYFFKTYNSRIYELFFNRNGIHLNISDVNELGEPLDNTSESIYGKEKIINYLTDKFKGVIRQNKINKLLNK